MKKFTKVYKKAHKLLKKKRVQTVHKKCTNVSKSERKKMYRKCTRSIWSTVVKINRKTDRPTRLLELLRAANNRGPTYLVTPKDQ